MTQPVAPLTGPEPPATTEGARPVFAVFLEGERLRLGWTREHMAAYLGVNVRTLDRWRLGETVPSRALCTLVRRALVAGPAQTIMDALAVALGALQGATHHRAGGEAGRALREGARKGRVAGEHSSAAPLPDRDPALPPPLSDLEQKRALLAALKSQRAAADNPVESA